MPTPMNQGVLYVQTETNAGTRVVPDQDPSGGVTTPVRIMEEPTWTPRGGLVEQDRPTPAGGGTAPLLDRIGWDFAVSVPASGINASRTVDWLALLAACPVAIANTTPTDGVGLAITPAPYAIVTTGNSGTPKTASTTWIEGGSGNPFAYLGRGMVCRLATIEGDAGNVRLNFEGQPLNVRTASDSPVGSVVPRGALVTTGTGIVYQSQAAHPEFRPRYTLTIDGGTPEVAEALAASCTEAFSFDPGMVISEVLCDQEVDGYDPAFVSYGPALLSLTLQQPAGGSTGAWDAMLDELTGVSAAIAFTREIGGVIWGLEIICNRFRVVDIQRGGTTYRTAVVVLQAQPSDAGNDQWQINLTRIAP
jgi:hypothetical protein